VLGHISGRRGRWQIAVDQLTRALSLAPMDYKIHGMRSYAARMAGQTSVALGDAQWMVDTVPVLPDGHARLGEALVLVGRTQEAAPHLRYAVEHGLPVDAEALRRANVPPPVR
jgi:Flp pilus assembly protein TadD